MRFTKSLEMENICKFQKQLTINSTIIFDKGIYLCHSPKIINPLTFNIKPTRVWLQPSY